MAGDATVTVVQFDDEDPHDVIVDARPIAEVRSIADRFEPRGMTPLYDALGLLLDRAERHGGDDADQLVVIMTDGMENASRRWDQPVLFRRIGELRRPGLDVRLPRRQPGQLRGGRRPQRRRRQRQQLPPTPPVCRRPTTGCPGR